MSVGSGWVVPGAAQRASVSHAWVAVPGCYHAWVAESGLGSSKFMGERANRGKREEEGGREREGESEEEREKRKRKKRNFGFSIFQNPNKYPSWIFKTSFRFDVFFTVISILNEYDIKSNFQAII